VNPTSVNLVKQDAGSIYRSYVLGTMIAVMALSWADRQLFAILLEKLRADLDLSETSLGLLGGLSFGVFYASLGVPLAMLADRKGRKVVIASAIAFWSLATVFCGLAKNYAGLFASRVLVAAGEAGGSPSAQAIVTEYFPPHQRGRALGLLFVHIPIGYVLAYLFGGWAADALGWRTTFIVFGAAGLVVAAVVALTVREPRTPQSIGSERKSLDFSILKSRSLIQIFAGGTVFAIGTFAASVWMPAFFIRTHGLTATEVGSYLALTLVITGVIGAFGGGYIVDSLAKRTKDSRWLCRLPALWIALTIPCSVGTLLLASAPIALICFGLQSFLNQLLLAPLVVSIQELSGAKRRAQGAALYLLAVNLIAASLGPALSGALSDALTAQYGTAGLKFALLLIVPTSAIWAVLHFVLAGRSIRADVDSVR